MNPKRIENATRTLAEGQDEYLTLCIRDERVELQGVGTVNGMVSAWEPTPQQLEILKAGGRVMLRILGTEHPPVQLWAEPSPAPAMAPTPDAKDLALAAAESLSVAAFKLTNHAEAAGGGDWVVDADEFQRLIDTFKAFDAAKKLADQ